MQFAVVTLFISAVVATPATISAKLARRDDGVCGDLLYGIPQCCSTNVLGIADLSCEAPSSANDSGDLKKSCSDAGASAHCCTLDLAGVGTVCKDV